MIRRTADGPGTADAAGATGEVSGRGSLHGLPACGALAGRLRVSALSGALELDAAHPTARAVPHVPASDVADGGDGAPPHSAAAAGVAVGDLLRRAPQDGHLGAAAAEGPRARQLPDGL